MAVRRFQRWSGSRQARVEKRQRSALRKDWLEVRDRHRWVPIAADVVAPWGLTNRSDAVRPSRGCPNTDDSLSGVFLRGVVLISGSQSGRRSLRGSALIDPMPSGL